MDIILNVWNLYKPLLVPATLWSRNLINWKTISLCCQISSLSSAFLLAFSRNLSLSLSSSLLPPPLVGKFFLIKIILSDRAHQCVFYYVDDCTTIFHRRKVQVVVPDLALRCSLFCGWMHYSTIESCSKWSPENQKSEMKRDRVEQKKRLKKTKENWITSKQIEKDRLLQKNEANAEPMHP